LIRRATQDKNLTANSDGQLKLHFEAARTWMGTDYRATIHTWKESKGCIFHILESIMHRNGLRFLLIKSSCKAAEIYTRESICGTRVSECLITNYNIHSAMVVTSIVSQCPSDVTNKSQGASVAVHGHSVRHRRDSNHKHR
jgi:hypothetical protein